MLRIKHFCLLGQVTLNVYRSLSYARYQVPSNLCEDDTNTVSRTVQVRLREAG